MAKKVFHIVPHDDKWALKSEGNPTAVGTFSTQREAIDEGRKMATDDPDEVDLIIHRTNGTIRERLSFGETDEAATNRLPKLSLGGTRTVIAPNTSEDREHPERVGPEDLTSVGTRVSWGAIAAGVVVALALQVLLGMLAVAIGLSVSGSASGETLGVGAIVTAAIALFASLFLGGLIATRITAGETQFEAVTTGILVWGSMFLVGSVLALTALGNLGYGDLYRRATGMTGTTAQRSTLISPEVLEGAGLSAQEQNNLLRALEQAEETALQGRYNAKHAAWWSFALILLSLPVAIGGAMLGCGPQLIFRNLRERDGQVALPPPNTTVGAGGRV